MIKVRLLKICCFHIQSFVPELFKYFNNCLLHVHVYISLLVHGTTIAIYSLP